MPGQAAFKTPDRRIPGILSMLSQTFISISPAATSSLPGARIPRDACWRHESSRSVFDLLLDEP